MVNWVRTYFGHYHQLWLRALTKSSTHDERLGFASDLIP
jgi:hypothetical protein